MPKEKKAEAGAPAWMVTFADLMSLLVCFFVLIISFSIQDTIKMQVVAGSMKEAFGVTTERKLRGIVELDGVPERRQAQNVVLIDDPITVEAEYAQQDDGFESGSAAEGAQRDLAPSAMENAKFRRTQAMIAQALRSDPTISDAADQVSIQMTEEGLEVILLDQDGRGMFDQYATEPNKRARRILLAMAPALKELPNRISIVGHTDASDFNVGGGYSKFELTAERANATRRVLQVAGIPQEKILEVAGRSDADPLFPDDPYLAGNRRVAITLMRTAPVVPLDHSL